MWPLVHPLALGLGRIGNFINGELPGRITEVPWALIYPGEVVGRHPSSLYQMSLEGPVLFGLVYLIARQRRGLGFNSGAFLALYAAFRFTTEFFRAPDPHMGFVAMGWMTQGQVLCVPMVILGLFLMLRCSTSSRRMRRAPLQLFKSGPEKGKPNDYRAED